MQSVNVTVKGLSAVLMNRFPLIPVEGLSKMKPAEQAEIAAYRDTESKELFMPGVNLQRCFVKGAGYVKGKGRSTLAKVTAACLFVSPEKCGLGTKHFEVDARAVVVPATRGRVVRYRPRLDQWQLTFLLEWDETMLSWKEVRAVVDNAGSRVGIGDFRPERGGPFGRFVVVDWKE